MAKIVKSKNVAAKALSEGQYRHKVVTSRKVYKRHDRHKNNMIRY